MVIIQTWKVEARDDDAEVLSGREGVSVPPNSQHKVKGAVNEIKRWQVQNG